MGNRIPLLFAAAALLFARTDALHAEDPAESPPPVLDGAAARKLAETRVDRVGGKASREWVRVVWPEGEPRPPEPGAEVVLIGGYISNSLRVLRWTGREVEARSLGMGRTWYLNGKGEKWTFRKLSIPPGSFALSWAAADRVIRARAERKPDPPGDEEDDAWTFIGGTHQPESWVRVGAPRDREPLFLANERVSSWDGRGVPDFEDVRAEVVHGILDDLVQAAQNGEGLAPLEDPVAGAAAWRPFLRRELERFLEPERPVVPGDDALLLVELCLRALGEIGEAPDRALLERVDAKVAAVPKEDGWRFYSVRDLRQEADLTRTRLRLRWAWDPGEAERILHEEPSTMGYRIDLVRWTRRLFHEKDPAAYRTLLLADLKRRVPIFETIEAIAESLPSEAAELLGPYRDDLNWDVREAVARALDRGSRRPEFPGR